MRDWVEGGMINPVDQSFSVGCYVFYLTQIPSYISTDDMYVAKVLC